MSAIKPMIQNVFTHNWSTESCSELHTNHNTHCNTKVRSMMGLVSLASALHLMVGPINKNNFKKKESIKNWDVVSKILPLLRLLFIGCDILNYVIKLGELSSSGPDPSPGPRSGPGRVQVRSQSGSDLDLDLDKRHGPGLTLNLVCHPPPENFFMLQMTSNL